ncbi:hypothetical protein BH09ACT12_BH09ACT12_33930 [soil metagenome]
MLLLAIVPAVVLGALVALTAVGASRRGAGLALAAVAGVFFPVTWTVWYVVDERPYERA